MAIKTSVSDGYITQTYDNGTVVKSPILKAVGWVTQRPRKGVTHFHRLFDLEDWEKRLWPWASHRMALTCDRPQEDPLFVSCPVGVKEGTKYQLLLCASGENNHPDQQWKIDSFELEEAVA